MVFFVSKKKPKVSSKKREVESPSSSKQCCSSSCSILLRILYKIPTAIILLFLIFVWSSSTTIISGKIVHLCVSSRKLNDLYCLSAGTQPKLEISVLDNTTTFAGNVDLKKKEIVLDKQVVHGNSTSFVASTTTTTTTATHTNVEVKKVNVSNAEQVFAQHDPTFRDSFGHDEADHDELEKAVKMVKDQLQVHRSWQSDKYNQKGCDGNGIYVYDLPTKFNKDLVGQCGDMVPWMNFCKYFTNEGLGQPIPKLGKAWYRTHQYSLEPIFHARVLKHPCRVHNEDEAKLFYVPFYGGLDILRWHFKNVSNDVKDSLGLELMKWLDRQRPWARNSGKDHVFVLGKISWDFRRKENSWGTRLLELEQMQNPTKLLIERQPWHENDIGIPHPTYFHPQSDQDIISWQTKIISSYRKHLVSFAGAARPDAPENIRSILINQCTSVDDQNCQFLDCSSGGCSQPESVIELFVESEFCLQPPGDSPTRKSVFDSLVSGCIPVLFDPFTAFYQYPWHLPEDHAKYSVFIDQKEVRQMEVNVVEELMKISKKQRDDMRRFIVYELLPGLVYGDTDSQFEKFQDSFSITMSNLLEKVKRLEQS
ncbi:xyloglucan-specific galacturonosyltransferase 1-like [Humulus lupulus]|uniref:xyloglucan-specific galacturonosyltransferase 1-like n=1 Tax=Humulus lupulus TaxID=3486 RepID=UPI002B4108A3|nr:xyloglucan-specific galacturonosyltransferase 1-like [Humulus lupulus]